VVIITGLGRPGQMGEALADAFAADGAALALIDRTTTHLDPSVAALRARGIEAHGFACDLTDHAAVGATAEAIRVALGDASAVVCAAGGFAMSGRVDESDVAVWERMLAVNLATAHVTTRAVLPMLRRTRGALVYFGSASVLPGGTGAGTAAYAAAKSGVLALMRAVAADERDAGVRANAVAPTAIRTAANLASMGPEARYVEREEVADVVRWLCSPGARAVTGQAIRL
jgi:NAD(P)-dependent dehydrogenase (short-subunit alcohol dehydrogenase family)